MIVKDDAVATVVIPTRDRAAELARALASCEAQTSPVEVIVIDSGADDGAVACVGAKFPDVRLVRHTGAIGAAASRNAGFRLASTQYVFSIDDDAEFADPGTIEHALSCFDDPRIAGLAMPHVNVLSGAPATDPPPDGASHWLTYTFVGMACALRRDLFLEVGGYDESLSYVAEELELCERLRAAGYVIRLVPTPRVLHYESPKRNFARQQFLGGRNPILIGWMHAPASALPAWWARSVAKALLVGARRRHVPSVLRGQLAGFAQLRKWKRRPVTRQQWALSMRLRRRGPARLQEVEALLPALRTEAIPAQNGSGPARTAASPGSDHDGRSRSSSRSSVS